MDKQQEFKLESALAIVKAVKEIVLKILASHRQPSAWEILGEVEGELGVKARWDLLGALRDLGGDPALTNAQRQFLSSLLESEDLVSALRGTDAPRKQILSSIDSLVRQSTAYRGTKEFQEMVSFMGGFRDYAPYNNMLVRIQNPTCSF